MTAFVLLAGLLWLLALLCVFPLPARLVPPPGAPAAPAGAHRVVGIGVALVLSLGTVGLYRVVGTPQAVQATATAPVQASDDLAPLRARLAAQPDNVDGWRQLARAHEAARQFSEAVLAYRQLVRLRPDDADLWLDYAVSLAMAGNQQLAGEPEKLIDAALQLKPDHVQGLALSGSARFERKDYAGAVLQWRRILRMLPDDSELAASVAQQIGQAEALASATPR